MNKLWIIFAVSCIGSFFTPDYQGSVAWQQIAVPHQGKHVLLELKDRNLHRIPQILVYLLDKYQHKKQLGLIDLQEDNRNKLSVTHRWLNRASLLLEIHCDYCTIEKRSYVIKIQEQKIIPLDWAYISAT